MFTAVPSELGQAIDVFMIRHGERIDETPAGDEWIQNNRERWYDPPLTDAGKLQAVTSAERLKTFVGNKSGIPFDKVFSSPLVRCLETSAGFSAVLGLPILPVPGLSSCTAAYKRHGNCTVVTHAKAQELCPGVEVKPYKEAIEEGFDATVERLVYAAADQGKKCILIVTHREGLRDTSKRTSTAFQRTAYCCIAIFRFVKSSQGSNITTIASPEQLGSIHTKTQFDSLVAPVVVLAEVDGVVKILQIKREEWGYAKLVQRLEDSWGGTGCIEAMHYTWYYSEKKRKEGKGEQHMLEDDGDVLGWLEQCESKNPPEKMLLSIRLSENATAAANAVRTEGAANAVRTEGACNGRNGCNGRSGTVKACSKGHSGTGVHVGDEAVEGGAIVDWVADAEENTDAPAIEPVMSHGDNAVVRAAGTYAMMCAVAAVETVSVLTAVISAEQHGYLHACFSNRPAQLILALAVVGCSILPLFLLVLPLVDIFSTPIVNSWSYKAHRTFVLYPACLAVTTMALCDCYTLLHHGFRGVHQLLVHSNGVAPLITIATCWCVAKKMQAT
jgi:broad specificity phosphatase PhoE